MNEISEVCPKEFLKIQQARIVFKNFASKANLL